MAENAVCHRETALIAVSEFFGEVDGELLLLDVAGGGGITNAVAEGLNSKIMDIKRRAEGYRNPANYKTVIYFYCGGLRLHP